MHIPVVYKHNFTHIAKSRATVVPKWSKRKPLGSVKKLFIKEVMVKISENCSSCALQSVGNAEKDSGVFRCIIDKQVMQQFWKQCSNIYS